MLKSIYKIENKINHKVYIGQTNNVTRRFYEHRCEQGHSEDEKNKVLYRAFRKYGIENFEFSVIEENVPNYNEREIYWIKYYDSYHNGYNMTPGGEESPHPTGMDHPMCTHSLDTIELVKTLLATTNLPVKKIARITGYDGASVNRINEGKQHYDENQVYPIRKISNSTANYERALNIIKDLQTTDLTQKQIAAKYNVARSTITAINIGQNYRQENIEYPIRK